MTSDADRAQRWHQTDHGDDRGAPLRPSRFITPLPEEEPEWVAARWIYCWRCDPYRSGRPNPFWWPAMIEVGGRPVFRP